MRNCQATDIGYRWPIDRCKNDICVSLIAIDCHWLSLIVIRYCLATQRNHYPGHQ